MVFKNLKTSTQISLKFTLFSAGILLILSLIMNVFFFSSWYFEIDLMRPDFFDRPPEGNREFSPWKNFPLRELRFPLGSVEATAIQEEIRFLDISEIDEYYLQVQKVGNWLVVRNVTQEVELQIMLLWISLLVIGGGMLLSYLVSLFFVKSALKKLNNLNEMLDSLDIDRLDQQLEITGHRHDEINRVMRKFNQALVKIECQTRGLKDFVKNASHELKTPLMGITSLLSLARPLQIFVAGPIVRKSFQILFAKA